MTDETVDQFTVMDKPQSQIDWQRMTQHNKKLEEDVDRSWPGGIEGRWTFCNLLITVWGVSNLFFGSDLSTTLAYFERGIRAGLEENEN